MSLFESHPTLATAVVVVGSAFLGASFALAAQQIIVDDLEAAEIEGTVYHVCLTNSSS